MSGERLPGFDLQGYSKVRYFSPAPISKLLTQTAVWAATIPHIDSVAIHPAGETPTGLPLWDCTVTYLPWEVDRAHDLTG